MKRNNNNKEATKGRTSKKDINTEKIRSCKNNNNNKNER